jgi:hypothetical protein
MGDGDHQAGHIFNRYIFLADTTIIVQTIADRESITDKQQDHHWLISHAVGRWQ